jgi:hypothetical protein
LNVQKEKAELDGHLTEEAFEYLEQELKVEKQR